LKFTTDSINIQILRCVQIISKERKSTTQYKIRKVSNFMLLSGEYVFILMHLEPWLYMSWCYLTIIKWKNIIHISDFGLMEKTKIISTNVFTLPRSIHPVARTTWIDIHINVWKICHHGKSYKHFLSVTWRMAHTG